MRLPYSPPREHETRDEPFVWECPHCGTQTVHGRAGGSLRDCAPDCTGYAAWPGPNFLVHCPDGSTKRAWDLGKPMSLEASAAYWFPNYRSPAWSPEKRCIVDLEDPKSPEDAHPGEWEQS